jgi:hypothetical protein
MCPLDLNKIAAVHRDHGIRFGIEAQQRVLAWTSAIRCIHPPIDLI